MVFEKFYERHYDNPKNKDGTDKPNKLLGEFEILENDIEMYCGVAILRDIKGNLFELKRVEISFNNGGSKDYIFPLEDNYFIKAYLKHKNI
jgi:hypothetical protein